MTEPKSLAALSDDAYEAIRAINHITVMEQVLLPQDVYAAVSGLGRTAYALRQAIGQLDRGLRGGMALGVQDAQGADPAGRIAEASRHLQYAAVLAEQLGESLDLAAAATTWLSADVPGQDGDL